MDKNAARVDTVGAFVYEYPLLHSFSGHGSCLTAEADGSTRQQLPFIAELAYNIFRREVQVNLGSGESVMP
jgi:hypothetical protein